VTFRALGGQTSFPPLIWPQINRGMGGKSIGAGGSRTSDLWIRCPLLDLTEMLAGHNLVTLLPRLVPSLAA